MYVGGVWLVFEFLDMVVVVFIGFCFYFNLNYYKKQKQKQKKVNTKIILIHETLSYFASLTEASY